MGLENIEIVDFIVKNPVTDGYDLIKIDDGNMMDEMKRYNLIIEKLISYANFVLSGQIYEETPEARGKEIRFCIIYETPPNEAMSRIEAIKPADDSSIRFPVIMQTQEEYFQAAKKDNSIVIKKPKRKWWKFW